MPLSNLSILSRLQPDVLFKMTDSSHKNYRNLKAQVWMFHETASRIGGVLYIRISKENM